jgi:hypothetical protein
MKTTTQVKSDGLLLNHNQAAAVPKVKTNVKSGGFRMNHNQSASS